MSEQLKQDGTMLALQENNKNIEDAIRLGKEAIFFAWTFLILILTIFCYLFYKLVGDGVFNNVVARCVG